MQLELIELLEETFADYIKQDLVNWSLNDMLYGIEDLKKLSNQFDVTLKQSGFDELKAINEFTLSKKLVLSNFYEVKVNYYG